MTPTPAAREETLEQIAERILWPAIGKVTPELYRGMVCLFVSNLKARDERAAQIVEHKITRLAEIGISELNWNELETLPAAIRERTE